MEEVLTRKGQKSKPALTQSRREQRRARRLHVLAAVALFAVFIAVIAALDSYRCSHEFVITKYVFHTDKVTGPVRMLMISDLHESEFGKNNSRLIAAAEDQRPDLILCVGDMITHTDTEEETHIGIDFLSAMLDIAPVYMSYGNHEVTYVDKHGPDLLYTLVDMGVRTLERRFVDVEAAGQTIRIGGVSDYCFNYGMSWETYHSTQKYAFLTEFCDSDNYSILLCHRPTDYYLKSEAASYENWDCDLVLCGHTHGGLWQLPVLGSLYLPQQGIFPKMDKGLFDMGNANMIVGGGLGHEGVLFRLFNPCELIVIELVPSE